MAKIVWDQIGEKKYETGVDHAVLYSLNSKGVYTPGVAWNGVTSIAESPDGAEPESQYADNVKYLTIISAEELNGTIEAFTYPHEWELCDGTAEIAPGVTIGQQARKTFGLSYRTKIGNDIDGQDHGYKLHLLYGGVASPSERTYETINESPEAISLSWDYTTTPVPVTGHNMTSLVTIDSTLVDKDKLAALEKILYGSEDDDARLPLPDEVAALLGEGSSEIDTARLFR
ncbi:MAG: hypothetical protein HDT39_04775 [Lachnospiraceae bacterium]|nr:hypothetical protein [Lachnospiraceae bacterium]